MSTQASFLSRLNITRGYTTAGSQTGSSVLNNETTKILNDTSTPAVTEGDYAEKSLTAGAATLDLTSFTSSQGRSINLNGLKVRQILLTAKAGNAGDITIAKGASNGYTGFGSSFSITLKPGQSILFDDAGVGVAVSGSVKTLDLSGTGTDTLQFSFDAGA